MQCLFEFIFVLITQTQTWQHVCNAGGDSSVNIAEQAVGGIKQHSSVGFCPTTLGGSVRFLDTGINDYVQHKQDKQKWDELELQKYHDIAYQNCKIIVDATNGQSCVGSAMKTAIFPDYRDQKEIKADNSAVCDAFGPIFTDNMSTLLDNALKKKSHVWHDYISSIQIQMQCHSIKQSNLKFQIDMQGCEIPFNSIECQLIHDPSHGATNQGLCKFPEPEAYDFNKERMVYKKFDLTSLNSAEQVEAIEAFVPTKAIDRWLSKNLEAVHDANSEWCISMTGKEGKWPSALGWDVNTKTEINNMLETVGSKKEYYERYIINKLNQVQQKNKISNLKKMKIKDIFDKNKNDILDNRQNLGNVELLLDQNIVKMLDLMMQETKLDRYSVIVLLNELIDEYLSKKERRSKKNGTSARKSKNITFRYEKNDINNDNQSQQRYGYNKSNSYSYTYDMINFNNNNNANNNNTNNSNINNISHNHDTVQTTAINTNCSQTSSATSYNRQTRYGGNKTKNLCETSDSGIDTDVIDKFHLKSFNLDDTRISGDSDLASDVVAMSDIEIFSKKNNF